MIGKTKRTLDSASGAVDAQGAAKYGGSGRVRAREQPVRGHGGGGASASDTPSAGSTRHPSMSNDVEVLLASDAERAPTVLMGLIRTAVAERVAHDEHFVSMFNASVPNYTPQLQPFHHFLKTLELAAEGRNPVLRAPWKERLGKWQQGYMLQGVTSVARLAMIFAYTINMPAIYAVLSVDSRLSAGSQHLLRFREFHELLCAGLKELPPVPHGVVLYRGMSSCEAAAWKQEQLHLYTPVSCTTSEAVAQQFESRSKGTVMPIRIESGVGVVSLSSVTLNNAEEEAVVLPAWGGVILR